MASSGNYSTLAELAAAAAPSPDSSTPANSLTQSPRIQFAQSGIQPPGGLYVTSAYSLRLTCWCSDPAVTGIVITALMLMPDGTIDQVQSVLAPITADRVTRNLLEFALPECFLISVDVALQNAFSLPGRVYVLAQLELGSGASATVLHTLAAGYVTGNNTVCWPNSHLRDSTEGQGYISNVIFAPPGPHLEASLVVPTGAIWDVRSLRLQLGTSAANLERYPALFVTQAGLSYGVQLSSGVDPSTTVSMTAIPGVARDYGPPGKRRFISVANPAAGTDWSVTVPAGVQWKVLGALGRLTTSATVANRIAGLNLYPQGAATFIGSTNNIAMVASTAYDVAWAVGVDDFGPTFLVSLAKWMQDCILATGDRINAGTVNLQAGDQWSDVYLWVEEFAVGDSLVPLPVPCRLVAGETLQTLTTNFDVGDQWQSAVALIEEHLVCQQ